MIERQHGGPGTIGQQHGLQRLTDTLEALQHGQTARHQRETQMVEALLTLHTRTTGLTWAVCGLAVLVVALRPP